MSSKAAKRIDLIETLRDIQAVILDLRDKTKKLEIEEADLEFLCEKSRLEAYDLAEKTSAIADDLSYQLSTCEDCLGDRIWKKHVFLKNIEEEKADKESHYKYTEYYYNVLSDSI